MPRRCYDSALLFVLAALAPAFAAAEGAYKVEALKEPPPPQVSAKVRELIQESGLKVVGGEGKALAEIWLRRSLKGLEPKNANGIDYSHLPEGAIVAVLRTTADGKDFRGNPFPAGVFTLRYALQPQDGDHQGASPTRDFLLLCPAKDDVDPVPKTGKEAHKLSGKVTGRSHPTHLYLVKLFDEPKKEPAMVEDADRHYWILDCAIPEETAGKKPLRLGIVLVGKAEEG